MHFVEYRSTEYKILITYSCQEWYRCKIILSLFRIPNSVSCDVFFKKKCTNLGIEARSSHLIYS